MPIRQAISNGLGPDGRKAEYVFAALYAETKFSRGKVWGDAHMTIGDCYDNEVEFACGFSELQPALTDKTKSVIARLRAFMKRLVDDGWIMRERIYNQQEYIGEMRSGWYPCFSLFPIRHRKYMMEKPRRAIWLWHGRETIE